MSIHLPVPNLPKALDLPRMTLKQPVPDVPAYKPMIIPPSDLEAPEGVKTEEEEKTEQPEPPSLRIPVIDIKMPIPETAVVVTAVTTAVIAVTTTTVTQSGNSDITFVASVFTGALATFGLTTGNKDKGKPINCPMATKKKEE